MGRGVRSTGTEFTPNPIPSIDEQHLALVGSLKKDLTALMQEAYPKAYETGFKELPPLELEVRQPRNPEEKADTPKRELEAWIDAILDGPTTDFLVKKERAIRPYVEGAGLATVFERFLPAVMEGRKGTSDLQYSVIVNARCVSCLADGRFRSGAGFVHEKEYLIGKPVRLDDLLSGRWIDLAVTDSDLERKPELRLALTPECEKHGRDNVVQLAVVHKVSALTHTSEGYLPILEARMKTTFEYLWKYVKYLEGQKEDGIPDAFAALVRTAGERQSALAILRVLNDSLPIWHGAISPQNHDDFSRWMRKQLGSSNCDLVFFRDRVEPYVVPESRKLRGQYVEVFRPFGPFDGGVTTKGSNRASFLVYTDQEYTCINGAENREGEGQSRLEYQRRREASRRETSTLGDWLIAQRLAGLSLDPQSVGYNRLIAEVRRREIMGLRKPKELISQFGFSSPSARS